MHLIIDGIIENLQYGGGCSIYFQHLLEQYQTKKLPLSYIRYNGSCNFIQINDPENSQQLYKMRTLERWRDVDTKNLPPNSIFHSTHYRLPQKKKNYKIVTTVHDFTYELYRKGPAQWAHSWQKNRAIQNSDKIICITRNTAKDLMRFCPVDEKKICVVYNGVSDDYFPIDNVNKTNEVIFVGARGGYKNFIVSVQAIALIPSLSLTIVGGGSLKQYEKDLLEKLLPNRYLHLGYISNEQLNIVYNRAFCLLYPSEYEGFGIPVIEAMRSGCCTIAVNRSSLPEIAEDAAYLLDDINSSSIAHALQELYNKNYTTVLRQKGLIQAAKFSWKKCFDETLAIYEGL